MLQNIWRVRLPLASPAIIHSEDLFLCLFSGYQDAYFSLLNHHVAPRTVLSSFIKYKSVKGQNCFKISDHRHLPTASQMIFTNVACQSVVELHALNTKEPQMSYSTKSTGIKFETSLDKQFLRHSEGSRHTSQSQTELRSSLKMGRDSEELHVLSVLA